MSTQAKYVAQCMEEIKEELRQENPAFKTNAVAKLTYVSTVVQLETVGRNDDSPPTAANVRIRCQLGIIQYN